ncbi:MerR family transcriptional regulator [Actinotalea sp.]|uniref:MerR family transcriptional regulator n=1 Tax=Actinotalea sp. TaxID=1872145 RepID=UPI002BDF15A4|nr:MerR family transcriptional regulator [Actinotalea sp.]HQY34003.1 MerR family transcriptional regulator [Actinotalea sp.]HRA50197.1 MerR family transcriptional regulator [Actinotalea sp.]
MAREHLLTIGEFSRLSRISVRMLRHYDEHDVLPPTSVDPLTGYRSYHPDLLRTARRVRALRDVGLGVAELAGCAPFDDAAMLRAVLTHQRGRLLDESAAVAERIREVDHLITQLKEPAMHEITRRTLPARTVASVRGTIPSYADEGLLWQRLMAALPAAGAAVAPDAAAVAVFHDEDYVEQDADVEVRLDVVAPFTGTPDVACVEVPAVDVAVGTLHGPYDGIGEVMDAIGGWIAAHGLSVAGPMFNVYVVGPEVSHEPSDWVTDVCVPVAG